MNKPTHAFRFESTQYSYIVDAEADIFGVTDPIVQCDQFRIIKFTPCGFWIEYGIGSKRFILDGCRRQFAHLEKEKALNSLIERKKAHVRHASKRLENAEFHLSAAEAYKAKTCILAPVKRPVPVA